MIWVKRLLGAERGLGKLMVELGKIAMSLLIALAIHEGILIIVKSAALDSGVSNYEKAVSDTNGRLKAAGISVEICLERPKSGSNCPGDVEPSKYAATWLALTVVDKDRKGVPVVFAQAHPTALVSNPEIVNSIHSFSRIVEKAHQGKEKGSTSDLKLCAGSLKVLDEKTCTEINAALDPLRKIIEADLHWIRILCLMFGIIQYLVLAVFVYILIESIGVRRRLFSPTDVFFVTVSEPDPNSGVPHPQIKLIDPADFPAAVGEYNKRRYRSAGDRLLARILQPSPVTGTAPTAAPSSVIEAFREYEISEPDGALSSLDVVNEAMLKLAFVGTIWGIGSALFLVRDLDSLDPVARIVTKSGMFAGIGTGFGTTMVGVLFSILASLYIQSISERWEDLVNAYYRVILNVGVGQIAAIASGLPVAPVPRPIFPPRPHRQNNLNVFRTVGLLALIGMVVFALWRYREAIQHVILRF